MFVEDRHLCSRGLNRLESVSVELLPDCRRVIDEVNHLVLLLADNRSRDPTPHDIAERGPQREFAVLLRRS